MKISCPNCNKTEITFLLNGFYLCTICDRVFSTNPKGGIEIKDGKPGLSSGRPLYPRPLKVAEIKFPQVFIKIGEKGISQKLLTNKILNIEGYSEYRKNSILKELKLKIK
ncbi:MAG: hypothetical protein RDU14_00835 [Melioribacteraceae bacterium]|nr:hypothetical protein [Melioribacteraceae bacterium]